MTRYLCISVTFLDPQFHGRLDGDRRGEWPPSPMRLFQALLAGARTGCRNREWCDAKVEAFKWLEGREPPEIVSPEAHPAQAYTLYVPNNDSDKEFDRHERLTAKVARPHGLVSGQALHYLWGIGEEEWKTGVARTVADVLCRETQHLLALGWGIDIVAGNGAVLSASEAQGLGGERWHPWTGYRSPGSIRRVPAQGTLEDLKQAHSEFLNRIDGDLYRPPRQPSVFDEVTYLRYTDVPRRRSAMFDLRDDHGRWQALRHTNVVVVAAMLRHVACEAAKRDPHKFEGGPEVYVAGHVGERKDSPPRFSYLPLPSIGHPHADGLIRRVLIAEHRGGDGTYARWAESRLLSASLEGTDRRVHGILTRAQITDRVYERYLVESRNWATVTPVALPGFDDGNQSKAERLFLKAVEQAPLPVGAVEEITLRKAPFWPGSQHPAMYRRPQEYLKNWPLWHAHIRFKSPVPGPISIGIGRHCGLGLFAAPE